MTASRVAADLGDELADELRRQIIAGRYAPGERLSEAEVSAAHGVSRNTLREAFRMLGEQGLLQRVPNRGVSVASPTTISVIDIYRVRRVLECAVLAAADPLHPGIAAMRIAVTEGAAAIERRDWVAVGTTNMAFHLAIVSLADSPRLLRTYRNLAAELRLAFLKIDDPELLHRPFVERNDEIVRQVEAGDRAAAVAALDRYLADSERIVLAAFTRLGLE